MKTSPQLDMFEQQAERKAIDQLLQESQLYKTSTSYFELLEFIKKLRNLAPFNAMLLHIQKPGLTYAAFAEEWNRLGRTVKKSARLLIILWPFGPVALVYDVQDTEGKALPQDVDSFPARGPITQDRLFDCFKHLEKNRFQCVQFDGGDAKAGSITLVERDPPPKAAGWYRIETNANHSAVKQFVTLAHELAHLYLGHLGADGQFGIANRQGSNHAQQEIEAESVAFLVCTRNGIESKAQAYLNAFVNDDTIQQLDLYQIMRAAGQIETLLGLALHTKKTSSTKSNTR